MLVLTVPVVVLAMAPALRFTYWQWLSLTLAAPAVAYGGLPFQAAWTKTPRSGNSRSATGLSYAPATRSDEDYV